MPQKMQDMVYSFREQLSVWLRYHSMNKRRLGASALNERTISLDEAVNEDRNEDEDEDEYEYEDEGEYEYEDEGDREAMYNDFSDASEATSGANGEGGETSNKDSSAAENEHAGRDENAKASPPEMLCQAIMSSDVQE